MLLHVAQHTAAEVLGVPHEEVANPLDVVASRCAVVRVVECLCHGVLAVVLQSIQQSIQSSGGSVKEESPALGAVDLGEIVEHFVCGQGLVHVVDTEAIRVVVIQDIVGPKLFLRGRQGGEEVAHAAVHAIEGQLLHGNVALSLGIVQEEVGIVVTAEVEGEQKTQTHQNAQNGNDDVAHLKEGCGTGDKEQKQCNAAQDQHARRHQQDDGHSFGIDLHVKNPSLPQFDAANDS